MSCVYVWVHSENLEKLKPEGEAQNWLMLEIYSGTEVKKCG